MLLTTGSITKVCENICVCLQYLVLEEMSACRCVPHISLQRVCIQKSLFYKLITQVLLSQTSSYHIATSYKSDNVLHSNSKVMQCIAI